MMKKYLMYFFFDLIEIEWDKNQIKYKKFNKVQILCLFWGELNIFYVNLMEKCGIEFFFSIYDTQK